MIHCAESECDAVYRQGQQAASFWETVSEKHDAWMQGWTHLKDGRSYCLAHMSESTNSESER